MSNDIIIIDDAISLNDQNEIETVCKMQKFNWFLNIAPSDFVYENENSSNVLVFTHTVITGPGPQESPFVILFVPIISAIPKKISKIMNLKVCCSLPTALSDDCLYSTPYSDFNVLPFEYFKAIYFVNDTDSDLVIFNEKNGQWGPLTIKQRIQSKKGRLVMFPGDYIHSDHTPGKSSLKFTVNLDFFEKDGGPTQEG